LSFQNIIKSVFLGLALASTGVAEQPKVHVSGIYSNLDFNDEAGDLNGIEVFIFFAGEHMVLYQESVGEPVNPSLVKAKVNGDSIQFTILGIGGGKRTFKGTITKTHLIGKFVGSNETIKLPRKNSYWQ
jgi:hypothetical protein